MPDPRLTKLAQVLVNYSAAVRPGDLVRIYGGPVTRPLLTEIYRETLRAGGRPYVGMVPDECEELLLVHGSEEQLRFENPLAQFETERIDVSIGLWGEDNTKSLSQADPARQALLSQARKRRQETFLARAARGELRWVGAQFPCHAAAQDAEMSLAEYEDFVFGAGFLHTADPVAAWRDLGERQQRLIERLTDVRELRLVTPQGTDLRVPVAGRTWINCAGRENFPDGEVFTAPHEDGVEGVVCFSFTAVYDGREVDDVRLEFRGGKVVAATASKNEAFLHAMLDQDAGARRLGEFALGCNYRVTRGTKSTLFDEKIGGTFHAALGAAYPESGGVNQSGLHWDLVCDLRRGGEVYADGELLSRGGRFLDPRFPQPQ